NAERVVHLPVVAVAQVVQHGWGDDLGVPGADVLRSGDSSLPVDLFQRYLVQIGLYDDVTAKDPVVGAKAVICAAKVLVAIDRLVSRARKVNRASRCLCLRVDVGKRDESAFREGAGRFPGKEIPGDRVYATRRNDVVREGRVAPGKADGARRGRICILWIPAV